MKHDACPPEADLSRGVPRGTDLALSRHLLSCAACRELSEQLERAIRLARELPAHVPSMDRREELRTTLLAAAASRPDRVTGRLATMGLVLGAAAAIIVVASSLARGRHPDPVGHSHATLRPEPGARYAIITPPPQETIRLWDGTVTFDVAPLAPHERLRVAVGDGEVEVRGTAFTVTARADRLIAVAVTRGRVDVRPIGAAAAVLDGGSFWRAPAIPESAPQRSLVSSPPPPPPVRERSVASRPAATHSRREPTQPETLYDDAWDALRAGDFSKAARGFARVSRQEPSGPLADEAAFWRATALGRSGDPSAAITTFRDFLARYPRSPRRGQASAILGWLLVDVGQRDEAAHHFRAAMNDSHDPARTSARDGLRSLSQAPPR